MKDTAALMRTDSLKITYQTVADASRLNCSLVFLSDQIFRRLRSSFPSTEHRQGLNMYMSYRVPSLFSSAVANKMQTLTNETCGKVLI